MTPKREYVEPSTTGDVSERAPEVTDSPPSELVTEATNIVTWRDAVTIAYQERPVKR